MAIIHFIVNAVITKDFPSYLQEEALDLARHLGIHQFRSTISPISIDTLWSLASEIRKPAKECRPLLDMIRDEMLIFERIYGKTRKDASFRDRKIAYFNILSQLKTRTLHKEMFLGVSAMLSGMFPVDEHIVYDFMPTMEMIRFIQDNWETVGTRMYAGNKRDLIRKFIIDFPGQKMSKLPPRPILKIPHVTEPVENITSGIIDSYYNSDNSTSWDRPPSPLPADES